MKKVKVIKSKKFLTILLMTAIFSVLFISWDKQTNQNENQSKLDQGAGTKLEMELRGAMDRLWVDHVSWTRNVILNIMDELPGTNDAINRLIKNQEDIGNAIKPYYGNDAGTKLTNLLKTHIVQAGDLLKATKSGDQDQFKNINEDWKENADSIAVFLSSANPINWPENEMKKMMQDHLSLTIDEAIARLKKDYPGDVIAYDKVVDEILMMSHMLSEGIIKQFPEKFAK